MVQHPYVLVDYVWLILHCVFACFCPSYAIPTSLVLYLYSFMVDYGGVPITVQIMALAVLLDTTGVREYASIPCNSYISAAQEVSVGLRARCSRVAE